MGEFYQSIRSITGSNTGQAHWMSITLPEVLLIRIVKVFTYPSATKYYFSNVEVRVGSEAVSTPASNGTISVNQFCAFFNGDAKDGQTVDFRCPGAGIEGNVVVLHRTDHLKLGLMQVQVLDCPFSFVWLSNACYKLSVSSRYETTVSHCFRSQAKVLTPIDERDYLVIESMMQLYSVSEVFVGVKKTLVSGRWMSESGAPFEGTFDWDDSTVPADLEYAQFAYIKKGNRTWHALSGETHAMNSICEYSNPITYTNWGITDGQFEPIEDDPSKKCAKVCVGATCTDQAWRSASCDTPLPFVCQVPFRCPSGWLSFDNSCYKHEPSLTRRGDTRTAQEFCHASHGASSLVINSRAEADFIATYLAGVENVPAYTGKTVDNANIGALIDKHGRYLKFVDGTYLMDGTFIGVTDVHYSSLYDTTISQRTFMITRAGKVATAHGSGSAANFMCEKRLDFDFMICIDLNQLADDESLESVASLDHSSRIEQDTLWPSTCIEYCRGLDYDYALMEKGTGCVCAPELKFNATSAPEAVTSGASCPLTETSKQATGAEDAGLVALYSTRFAPNRFHGDRLAPGSCQQLQDELLLLSHQNFRHAYLQHEPGNPVLKADCSRDYQGSLCVRNMLLDLSDGTTIAFDGLSVPGDKVAQLGTNLNLFPKEALVVEVCRQQVHYNTKYEGIGTVKYLCDLSDEANTALDTNSTEGYFKEDVGITITFSAPTIVSGVLAIGQTQTHQTGFLQAMHGLSYEWPSYLGSHAFSASVSGLEFAVDSKGKSDRRPAFIANSKGEMQPVVTKQLTFAGLQLAATKTVNATIAAELVLYMKMQLMIFGCTLEEEISEVLCPDGWISPSSGDCFRLFTQEESLTKEEAGEQCKKVQGILASPYSSKQHADMTALLTNHPEEMPWIGISYAYGEISQTESWNFIENEVPVVDTHHSHWLNEPLLDERKCAQMILEQGQFYWKQVHCEEEKSTSYICSRKQTSNFIGCYAIPESELNASPLTLTDYKESDHLKCREHCVANKEYYYVIQNLPGQAEAKCNCLQLPRSGMLPVHSCELAECSPQQDPDSDNCHSIDNFKRGWLYKSWSLSCPVEELLSDETTFAYLWDFHGRHHYNSSILLRCLPGFSLDPSLGGQSGYDFNLDTQELRCDFDGDLASWQPAVVPCVPSKCIQEAPTGDEASVLKALESTIIEGETKTVYTNFSYSCKIGDEVPEIVRMNYTFSLDPLPTDNFIQKFYLTCTPDKKWETHDVPHGTLCPPTESPKEKCELPDIPDCVDANIYCSPINDPLKSERVFVQQVAEGYDTIYGTELAYSCPDRNHYFGYSLPHPFISYFYSTNVKNVTVRCNADGNWEILRNSEIEEESCLDIRGDGSCGKVRIPDCEDRTIRCEPLQRSFGSADVTVLQEPNPEDWSEYGTEIELRCLQRNHYFDFSVPEDLISFYYSDNINYTKLYCNQNGTWEVIGGFVGDSCPESEDPNELQCKAVSQPDCVDRTIRCHPLQNEFFAAEVEYLNEPNVDDHSEYGTTVRVTCPDRNHHFDYAVPDDLVSFFYSNNINETVLTCHHDRFWVIEKGGFERETCAASAHETEFWCDVVYIPMCVDRTIRCTDPPQPEGSTIDVLHSYRENDFSEVNTTIRYRCLDRKYAFDYPVGSDFVSFYYTANVHDIEISCNNDAFWEVQGGLDGLTCPNTHKVDGVMWCKDLSIPDCVDRTVYCSDPPLGTNFEHGQLEILRNPSPNFPQCAWTSWFNADMDTRFSDDMETYEAVLEKYPDEMCHFPMDIQARTLIDKIPANETGQVFEVFSAKEGFKCVKDEQNTSACLNYEVRFCCPYRPENDTVLFYSCDSGYPWFLDYQDLPFSRAMVLMCTNNGTWTTSLQTTDFCPQAADSTTECIDPKIAMCKDRKVRCLAPIPTAQQWAQEFNVTSPGLESNEVGASFVYRCNQNGWVFNTTNHPHIFDARCEYPENYPKTWHYNIWNEGEWSISEVPTCLDPNICHKDLPALPIDSSVKSNVSAEYKRRLGTAFEYHCEQQYWVFDFPPYRECEDTESQEACEQREESMVHHFNKGLDAVKSVIVECVEGDTLGDLPSWTFHVEGYYRFQDLSQMASCYNPTACEQDPPDAPSRAVGDPLPERGSVYYGDDFHYKYYCEDSDIYRFMTLNLPRLDWPDEMNVTCGWGKEWIPKSLPPCVDFRDCDPPPLAPTSVIGEFELLPEGEGSLSPGTVYWYKCKAGVFMNSMNAKYDSNMEYIFVECQLDAEGGPPRWMPEPDFHECGLPGLVNGAPCQCNAACSDHGDCCSDYQDICLSCENRCDIAYYPLNECQCNSECPQHGNCCTDFNDWCDGSGTDETSCEGRCDIGYDPNLPCQCNSECPQHGNCCADFDTYCDGSSGGVTNADLIAWSSNLITLDVNNCYGQYSIDYQGQTSQCSTSDQAPGPLFTSFDDTIWDKPSIFLFRELFDNYDRAVTVVEDHTVQEQAEENAFLVEVMDSAVMINAYEFLYNASVFTGTIGEFQDKLVELWFDPYDRDGTSADVKGSSGFEHVFMGEIKQGDISGFHNWLHWYSEESAGNIDYFGWLEKEVSLNPSGDGITNVFEWYGASKCIGGNLIGTSPELELALYTVCFLTRGNGNCAVQFEGVNFDVVTYDLIQDGKTHIGTAYPSF